MAASNSQRNWNRFFDHSKADGEPGDGKKSVKRTRRARTTCENYDKSTESCRLGSGVCLAPGRCPDYARRPDVGAPAKKTPPAPRPKIENPATEFPTRESPRKTCEPGKARQGHALAPMPEWEPETPGDWNFVPDHTVVHKYFGQGTVVSVENGYVVVDFESVGRKTLLGSFFSKHPIMYIKR